MAGKVGRVTKLLMEEGEGGLVEMLKGLLNWLAQVGVAGGLSRQVGEEEGLQAKWEEEVLLDVEGVHIRLSAGEVARLEGDEGGG